MLRHARAKNYYVELTYGEDQLHIEARDDGVGIAPKVLSEQNSQSWGLMGMQEKINLLEGQFRINSSPGVGTKITISIPYQTKNSNILAANEVVKSDN